jgi:hypothetical protein
VIGTTGVGQVAYRSNNPGTFIRARGGSCLYFTTYSKLATIHLSGHYAYWLQLNPGPLPFSMLSQVDTVVCREDLTSRRQSLVRWQTPSLVSAFAFADNTLFAANATNFGAQPRDRPIPTRMDPRSLLTPKRSRWPVRHTNALRPHGSNAVASYDQRLASAPQESEPGAATSPEIENRHFA